MASLQTFRHYCISQDRTGGAVELWRTAGEMVCLAVDAPARKFVELHIITGPPQSPEVFQQLVQLAAPLRHPNLLGVIEGGEDDGSNFFITEFLDGERLEPWLARCAPLPPWLALQTLDQLLAGLEVLAPFPRLLAGVDLSRSGICLTGPGGGDFTAKVAVMGPAAPSARQATARKSAARLVREAGRLLRQMLTGAAGDSPPDPAETAALAPELSFLLHSLLDPAMPHHPQSLEQLAALAGRCAGELSTGPGTPPEQIPPELLPELPLQPHFLSGAEVAAVSGDDCTIDTRPFNALDPYRLHGVERATRMPVSVQLLPPARLMPPDYAGTIVRAGERIHPRDHPRLLRVLAWDAAAHPEMLVEECPGRWTLDQMVRVRGQLTPAEAAFVLEELEAAAAEAEACGLVAELRCPGAIPVQFTAPGGDKSLPSAAGLARKPLDAWPAFRFKVRTWPLTLQFTQPERFQPGRPAPGGSGEAEGPEARDYAQLVLWMLGGMDAVPGPFQAVIGEILDGHGGGGPAARRRFLDQFLAAAVSPPAPPKRGRKRGAEVFQAPDPDPADESGAPVPGFAETLFGRGGDAPGEEPHPLFRPAAGLEDAEDLSDPGAPLPGLFDHGALHPGTAPDEPPPNRLLLWLFVIGLAALLAAVAAHISGTAFWQR